MNDSQDSQDRGEAARSAPSERELSAETYAQLKRLAQARLNGQRPGMTLDCTSLVHEAFLKLNGSAAAPAPDETHFDENHFLAVAALAMRQILLDHLREKKAEKRCGGALRVTLQESLVPDPANPLAGEPGGPGPEVDLLELDAALRRLAQRDPELEKLVALRFFGGLTMEQTARALGRSQRSLERDWTRARVYLYRELGPRDG